MTTINGLALTGVLFYVLSGILGAISPYGVDGRDQRNLAKALLVLGTVFLLASIWAGVLFQ